MAKVRRIRDQKPGRHRQALEETLESVTGITPALAELARALADQCDQAQPEPSTSLLAGYLSALKDIQRYGRGAPAGMSKLEQMRATRGRPAPGKLAQLRANAAAMSPIPDNTPRNGA